MASAFQRRMKQKQQHEKTDVPNTLIDRKAERIVRTFIAETKKINSRARAIVARCVSRQLQLVVDYHLTGEDR